MVGDQEKISTWKKNPDKREKDELELASVSG